MRALKQELSQATPGSWSSWPGVSPSLIFATIFVPSPPFWGVPASSAPSGGLTPNPQPPRSWEDPWGSPLGLAQQARGGGWAQAEGCLCSPARPQEGSGLVPALLHSRPAPPRNLVAAQPPSTARPEKGWKAAPTLPTPVPGLGLIHPKPGSQARGAGTAWGSPSSPLLRRVKLLRALHTAGAARMLSRGGAYGRKDAAAQKAGTRVSQGALSIAVPLPLATSALGVSPPLPSPPRPGRGAYPLALQKLLRSLGTAAGGWGLHCPLWG